MAMLETGNVVMGVIGLTNIGAIIYLVRVVIAPIAQSVALLTKSVDELYEGRNQHEVRVTRIETIHKIRGCDEPKHKE